MNILSWKDRGRYVHWIVYCLALVSPVRLRYIPVIHIRHLLPEIKIDASFAIFEARMAFSSFFSRSFDR